jgi:hypothetical protein
LFHDHFTAVLPCARVMDAKDKTTPSFRYSAMIIGNTANHVPLPKIKPRLIP